MTDVFNLFDGELDDERDVPAGRGGERSSARRSAPRSWARACTSSSQARRRFPYHYEYGAEEWLLVVDGATDASGAGRRARAAAGRRRLLPRGPGGRPPGTERHRRADSCADRLDEVASRDRGLPGQRQGRHLDGRSRPTRRGCSGPGRRSTTGTARRRNARGGRRARPGAGRRRGSRRTSARPTRDPGRAAPRSGPGRHS